MRISIDLPDDLHRQAMSIARDTSLTLSETVVELMRRALEQEAAAALSTSERTSLPEVHLGRVITTDDVRALEDED